MIGIFLSLNIFKLLRNSFSGRVLHGRVIAVIVPSKHRDGV